MDSININWSLYESLFRSLSRPYSTPHYLTYDNVDPKNENRHYLRDAEGLPEHDISYMVDHYGSACRYPYSGVILGTTADQSIVKHSYEYPPLKLEGGTLDRLGNTNLPAYNFNIHPLYEIDYKGSNRNLDNYKTSVEDDRNKYYHILHNDHLLRVYPYGNSPKWSIYNLYYTPTRKEWNPSDLVCTTDKYIQGCSEGVYSLHKYLHDTLVMLLNNEHWGMIITEDESLKLLLDKICYHFEFNIPVLRFNPLVVDTLNIHNVPLSCAIRVDSNHFSLLDAVEFTGPVLAISTSNKDYVRGIFNYLSDKNVKSLPVTLFGVYS